MNTQHESPEQWERAVIAAIEEQCECTTSDAQAIMEAQDFTFTRMYAAKATPSEAAAAILKAGAA